MSLLQTEMESKFYLFKVSVLQHEMEAIPLPFTTGNFHLLLYVGIHKYPDTSHRIVFLENSLSIKPEKTHCA